MLKIVMNEEPVFLLPCLKKNLSFSSDLIVNCGNPKENRIHFLLNVTKVSLPHAFSTCVYFMLLRFQRSYFGWLKPTNQKMQTHAANARWKRENVCGNSAKIIVEVVDELQRQIESFLILEIAHPFSCHLLTK